MKEGSRKRIMAPFGYGWSISVTMETEGSLRYLLDFSNADIYLTL